MDCTVDAKQIIRNTGSFIMKNMFLPEDKGEETDAKTNLSKSKRIRFQFVSDTADRDVNTTEALLQGFKDVAETLPSVKIESEIQYSRALFKKIKGNGNGRLCQTTYSKEHLSSDVLHRLENMPIPFPGLNDTLSLLQTLGGVGENGPLTYEEPLEINLGKKMTSLIGPINLVKRFAQFMYHTRAGGIDPPFLPKATVEDVYRLFAWINYYKSVISVDNVGGAAQGAVMTQAVLEALRDGQYGADKKALRRTHKYDASVTVIVGHDNDFNAIATSLGLRWKLSPPYYQGDEGEYTPIPPGSAMHFAHDVNSGAVGSSFLYPIHLNGEGLTWTLNKTGILESAPVLFVPNEEESHLSEDQKTTWIRPVGDDNHTGIDVLNKRVISMLEKYPEAVECYSEVVDCSRTVEYTQIEVNLEPELKLLYVRNPTLIMCGVFFLGFLFACALMKKQVERKFNGRQARYTECARE